LSDLSKAEGYYDTVANFDKLQNKLETIIDKKTDVEILESISKQIHTSAAFMNKDVQSVLYIRLSLLVTKILTSRYNLDKIHNIIEFLGNGNPIFESKLASSVLLASVQDRKDASYIKICHEILSKIPNEFIKKCIDSSETDKVILTIVFNDIYSKLYEDALEKIKSTSGET
jgi:hypothetical protein